VAYPADPAQGWRWLPWGWFAIGEFGDASAEEGVQTAYADDLGKAGMLSLPITLTVLVLAFGALVAAGIPLLLALTAVFATFGLIALPSAVLPVAMEAPAMVLLIGLAVGVDYSMFYLKREREERAAGRSESAALEAAAATSGRSVLVSGLTVLVAMSGMFLTGDPDFASFAIASRSGEVTRSSLPAPRVPHQLRDRRTAGTRATGKPSTARSPRRPARATRGATAAEADASPRRGSGTDSGS